MAGPLSSFTIHRAELTAIASWGSSPVHAAESGVGLSRRMTASPTAKSTGRLRRRLEQEFLPGRRRLRTAQYRWLYPQIPAGAADGRANRDRPDAFPPARHRLRQAARPAAPWLPGFCATGQMGFARPAHAREIVAQCLHVRPSLDAWPGVADPGRPHRGRLHPPRTPPRHAPPAGTPGNVVPWDGEPLTNYDAVMSGGHPRDQTARRSAPTESRSARGVIPASCLAASPTRRTSRSPACRTQRNARRWSGAARWRSTP